VVERRLEAIRIHRSAPTLLAVASGPGEEGRDLAAGFAEVPAVEHRLLVPPKSTESRRGRPPK